MSCSNIVSQENSHFLEPGEAERAKVDAADCAGNMLLLDATFARLPLTVIHLILVMTRKFKLVKRGKSCQLELISVIDLQEPTWVDFETNWTVYTLARRERQSHYYLHRQITAPVITLYLPVVHTKRRRGDKKKYKMQFIRK